MERLLVLLCIHKHVLKYMYIYRCSHLQERVEQWSKVAYETLPSRQPDYEMDNGKPRPISQSIFQGSVMLEPKFMQDHLQSKYVIHTCYVFRQ